MNPMLSCRFEEALLYATRKHASQVRKGTPIPYIAHLMAVAAIVLEDGGDEDQAIAALLHDAVEDQGGKPTLDEIRTKFGERVAGIVEGCTDADTIPKPPWRNRKESYIRHLHSAPPEVLRVSLADKIHNVRAVLRDYRAVGENLWKRFQGGKEGTLWYYRALADTFGEIRRGSATEEFARTVAELEHAVESNHQPQAQKPER